MTYSQRKHRVVALLEDNVRTELQIADGALGLGLTDDAIETLMGMITSSVLNAFQVDWSPDWVQPGEVHAWEGSEGWHARCAVCLEDSPRSEERQGAVHWAVQHQVSH